MLLLAYAWPPLSRLTDVSTETQYDTTHQFGAIRWYAQLRYDQTTSDGHIKSHIKSNPSLLSKHIILLNLIVVVRFFIH